MVELKFRCTPEGRDRLAKVWMYRYAQNGENITLCPGCALQLARKILEDLCAIDRERYG